MKFSIITISFNSENTIERTIKSVLTQTYKDYEYIIVDGASKDSTIDIVTRYEPLFEGRMKWQSEPDKGIYDAMNKGINVTIGEIIGIVNSDDWLEPDALDKVNNAFMSNGQSLDCIYSGGMLFHSANGTIQRLMPNYSSLKRYALVGDIAGIRHPATFVPKKVYNEYGKFDTRMKISADADFLLRFYFKGGEYLLIDEIVTNMSDGGASNTLTFEYVYKKMLPDRRILMRNLGFSPFRQKVNIVFWSIKMCLKVCLNRISLFKVR